MDNPEKIEWILNKITFLESELAKLKKPQNQWLTLEEAAAELGKSVSAVRQRVKIRRSRCQRVKCGSRLKKDTQSL